MPGRVGLIYILVHTIMPASLKGFTIQVNDVEAEVLLSGTLNNFDLKL